MGRQNDMLDFVVDNPALNRREVYRNGRVLLTSRSVDHPLLKHFEATGPWGTYPPAPPGSLESPRTPE